MAEEKPSAATRESEYGPRFGKAEDYNREIPRFIEWAKNIISEEATGYKEAGQKAWRHGPIDALPVAYRKGGGGWPGVMAAIDQGGRELDFILPGVGKVLSGAAGAAKATIWPLLTARLGPDISSGGRKVAEAINSASSSNLDELRRVPESTWKEIVGDLDSTDFDDFQMDFNTGKVDVGFVGSRAPTTLQAEQRAEMGLNPSISGPLLHREVGTTNPLAGQTPYEDWGRVLVTAPPRTGRFSIDEALAIDPNSPAMREGLVNLDLEGDRFGSEISHILFPDAQNALISGHTLIPGSGPRPSDYTTVIDMGGPRYRPQYWGAGMGPQRVGRSDPRNFASRDIRGEDKGGQWARDSSGVDLGTTTHTGWQDRRTGEYGEDDLFDLLRRDAEGGDIEANFIMALRDAIDYERGADFAHPARMEQMRDMLSGIGRYPEAGPVPELIDTDMGILERIMRKWADEGSGRPTR